MITYKDILNDKEILAIYKKIDETSGMPISYGLKHVKDVVKNCFTLSHLAGLKDDSLQLLLIAATLYNIGVKDGLKNYAASSIKFAKSYLKGKLWPSQIDRVCYAIEKQIYNEDEKITDDIAYCLPVADKMDMTKSRLLPNQEIDDNFDIFRNTKTVKIVPEKNNLILEIKGSVRLYGTIAKENFQTAVIPVITNFTHHFGYHKLLVNIIVG